MCKGKMPIFFGSMTLQIIPLVHIYNSNPHALAPQPPKSGMKANIKLKGKKIALVKGPVVCPKVE
jgi:hypothetical protein